MGTVVDIVEYCEEKVNNLAQQYRHYMGTCMEREMKEVLRTAGERLARLKMFKMQQERKHEGQEF
jgi:hypothetical protein